MRLGIARGKQARRARARRDGDAGLADQRVPKAALVAAVVAELLVDQIGGKHLVAPAGNLVDGVALHLAGARVHQNRARIVLAAEQPDAHLHRGHDPIRRTVVVNLEGGVAEHLGGVREAHVAVEVVVEVLGRGDVHVLALVEAHELGLLCGHVHRDVSRQAGARVRDPLDDVGIDQRADAVGRVLVADLRVGVVALVDGVLADQVAHLADGTTAQAHGGVLVYDRHVRHAHLADVGGKVAGLGLEQAGVGARVEKRRGGDVAHEDAEEKKDHDDDEPEEDAVALALFTLLAVRVARALSLFALLAVLLEDLSGALRAQILDELRRYLHALRYGVGNGEDDDAPDAKPPKADVLDIDRGDGDVVEHRDDCKRDDAGQDVFLECAHVQLGSLSQVVGTRMSAQV